MRLAFLTATPLNVRQGGGTYAGVSALANALRDLGVAVEIFSRRLRVPVFTARRLLFNEQLRGRRWDAFDAVVGFDMDGYRLAGRGGLPHVASIKGVIADEMRFERGLTRLTMSIQAACEARHARRADLVVTTSAYAAGRIQELYGIPAPPAIVPELIDLDAWRELFAANPAAPDPARFSVLSVCRFYPRKRLHLLLEAAAQLRDLIPGLQVRLVGNGPERRRLHSLWRQLRLQDTAHWLGNLSQEELAREYNRCDLFCLPSVQEGFGIVFLEAMAAGKPIVAARAGAAPEVVEQGLLVQPESAEALAEGIHSIYRSPDLADSLRVAGRSVVERYRAPRVAEMFLARVRSLL
ncbi:MAG TPA: glycosyltransferase family 4 protein [Bryobacteraceae bacterium]|nr:glycosyltransferase family 4 protein [Bryobacteraceae bacterium]